MASVRQPAARQLGIHSVNYSVKRSEVWWHALRKINSHFAACDVLNHQEAVPAGVGRSDLLTTASK
jgi:hypothetical protein